jgi:hypothetical protein
MGNMATRKPRPHRTPACERRPCKPAADRSAEPPADDCADLPLDEEPSLVLSRRGRVALYERRAGEKRSLFHPDDLVSAARARDRDGLPASLTR